MLVYYSCSCVFSGRRSVLLFHARVRFAQVILELGTSLNKSGLDVLSQAAKNDLIQVNISKYIQPGDCAHELPLNPTTVTSSV